MHPSCLTKGWWHIRGAVIGRSSHIELTTHPSKSTAGPPEVPVILHIALPEEHWWKSSNELPPSPDVSSAPKDSEVTLQVTEYKQWQLFQLASGDSIINFS